MVTSELRMWTSLPPGIQSYTPARLGLRPVSKPTREGEQTGAVE